MHLNREYHRLPECRPAAPWPAQPWMLKEIHHWLLQAAGTIFLAEFGPPSLKTAPFPVAINQCDNPVKWLQTEPAPLTGNSSTADRSEYALYGKILWETSSEGSTVAPQYSAHPAILVIMFRQMMAATYYKPHPPTAAVRIRNPRPAKPAYHPPPRQRLHHGW